MGRTCSAEVKTLHGADDLQHQPDRCGGRNQLKYDFGRTWPETWINNNPSLISNGAYGFNFFHGGPGYSSFPSGHMTVICAVTSVLWIYYPKLRVLYALVVAAIALGLLGADYHFVSDIIAGVLLGTVTGWLAVAVQEQAANKLTSVNPTPK